MTEFFEYITGILILTGSLFILISAIGIVKMPDIYIRMSATTKAATLGVGSVMLGSMLFFSDIGAITRSFAIMLFIFLTAPVAAHMLGRASYFEDLPMWKGTKINELKGKYCKKTHKIYSHDIENEEECQD